MTASPPLDELARPGEELDGRGDICLGLFGILIEGLHEGLGVRDLVSDLAVIQVGREGDITIVGQAVAEGLDRVVKSPPGM